MRNTLHVFIVSVVVELIFVPSEKSFCTQNDYKQWCRETVKLDWVERKGYWKSSCQGCGGVGWGWGSKAERRAKGRKASRFSMTVQRVRI